MKRDEASLTGKSAHFLELCKDPLNRGRRRAGALHAKSATRGCNSVISLIVRAYQKKWIVGKEVGRGRGHAASNLATHGVCRLVSADSSNHSRADAPDTLARQRNFAGVGCAEIQAQKLFPWDLSNITQSGGAGEAEKIASLTYPFAAAGKSEREV